MARSRRKGNERQLLATFLAISFVLGALLGAVIATTWIRGLPTLQLSPGEFYTRSITIVGVNKTTGEGELATLVVEVRAGSGRLLFSVPPYENEDTQAAAQEAKTAAASVAGYNLSDVDVIISVENLFQIQTTIAGPSTSAAVAVLIVAAARAKENVAPNAVRQGVVISASINANGRLQPVGEIQEKYQTVSGAEGYSLFVIAEDQPGSLPNYPVSVERALNLSELENKVLR